MVFGVQARLAFANGARRDQVLDAITTRIAGRPRWSVDTVAPGSWWGGVGGQEALFEFGLFVELRFVSALDAEDLRARVESFASGPRAPLAGSWLRVHSCTHDESTNICIVVAERAW